MKSSRNYPLLLSSQFLSAFGDNAILMVILGPLMGELARGLITGEQQSIANIYYTSLLFVPYVILAPLAGYLNDRFSKTKWLLGGNLVKLLGTGLAAVSILTGADWRAAGYFIIGIGACIYSPAKYGILPEILPVDRLVKANGMVELLTLVAILTGSITGALIIDHLPVATCYLIVAGIYGFSMVMNAFMSATPSYPEVRARGTLGEFWGNFRHLFASVRLARILIGTAVFWICGAMMKMNFQPWGQQVLELKTMTQINLLGLWLSIGVMVGSILAGRFFAVGELQATRRFGWLLAGALGLLGAMEWFLHRGLGSPQALAIPILIATGIVAGLFLIPLNAALQAESHKDKLGKTIATQNAFENLAMLGGSLFAFINVKIGFDPSQLFIGLAVFVGLVVTWLRFPPSGRKQGEQTHEPRAAQS